MFSEAFADSTFRVRPTPTEPAHNALGGRGVYHLPPVLLSSLTVYSRWLFGYGGLYRLMAVGWLSGCQKRLVWALCSPAWVSCLDRVNGYNTAFSPLLAVLPL